MIDPFDVEGKDKVLEYLSGDKKISNPAGSFVMRTSEKSKAAMIDQL